MARHNCSGNPGSDKATGTWDPKPEFSDVSQGVPEGHKSEIAAVWEVITVVLWDTGIFQAR